MEPAKEWIELGPGAHEYGRHEVVITADDDGVVREGSSRVFIADDKCVLWEWKLRDVLPGGSYTQCNLLRPDNHKHGVTMFIFPGYVTVGPDKYKLADTNLTLIEAIPWSEG